jgi:hypothetical protein
VLPQFHPGAAVSVDEDHAGALERGADRGEGVRRRNPVPFSKSAIVSVDTTLLRASSA